MKFLLISPSSSLSRCLEDLTTHKWCVCSMDNYSPTFQKSKVFIWNIKRARVPMKVRDWSLSSVCPSMPKGKRIKAALKILLRCGDWIPSSRECWMIVLSCRKGFKWHINVPFRLEIAFGSGWGHLVRMLILVFKINAVFQGTQRGSPNDWFLRFDHATPKDVELLWRPCTLLRGHKEGSKSRVPHEIMRSSGNKALISRFQACFDEKCFPATWNVVDTRCGKQPLSPAHSRPERTCLPELFVRWWSCRFRNWKVRFHFPWFLLLSWRGVDFFETWFIDVTRAFELNWSVQFTLWIHFHVVRSINALAKRSLDRPPWGSMIFPSWSSIPSHMRFIFGSPPCLWSTDRMLVSTNASVNRISFPCFPTMHWLNFGSRWNIDSASIIDSYPLNCILSYQGFGISMLWLWMWPHSNPWYLYTRRTFGKQRLVFWRLN